MQFTAHYSSSTGNLYTVKSGNNMLLVECGVSIKAIRKVLNYRLSEICGCLISHAHQDHCKAVKDIQKAGIDCYVSRETSEALNLNSHRTQIIEPLKQFKVNGLIILPFPTEHDCPGSLGFLISDGNSKICFITDSFYSKFTFKGVTCYALECNWSKKTLSSDLDPIARRRLFCSHFSLENVIEFLKANDLSKCREIHLLHLSNNNSDAEYFKREVQATTGKPVCVAKRK